jgi:protein Mpv17
MWPNRLFVFYERLATRYPLTTNSVMSGILWGSGDIAAQSLEPEHSRLSHSSTCGTTTATAANIDWQRVAIQSMYASILWAPFGHYWYRSLDWSAKQAATILAKRTAWPRKHAILMSKVAMEAVLLHPIALLAYFTCIGTMNGESTRDIGRRLHNDFLPTVCLEIALWTPLDVANFVFVPVRHQLLVVNCGCFLESVGLSYIHRNGLNIFETQNPDTLQAKSTSIPRSQYMR